MRGPEGETKSVGIWIRVSTEDQVRGESPEHHEKRARAYAEARGWDVVKVYRLEAVSGKAVKAHPEAQRMLQDMKSGTISGLVFSKLARLARNTRELLEFAEEFRAGGADLISLQEAIDTSSPAGRLFFTMIAAMAQWEREEIADRVAASVPVRAKMGKSIGGAAPFGYRWLNKQLVPHPEEAPVRRLLHELFVEHKRKKAVARILNERGYRARSGPFSDTTVGRLLLDPTAKGLHRANYTRTDDNSKSWSLKPEEEWVYTPVEAIVPEELWDRCAQIVEGQLAARTPVAKRATYLFAGVTFCTCGTKMYVRSNSPKYVCEACRNKIPIVDLEGVYREQLRHFLVSPAEIEAHNAAVSDAMNEKIALIEAAERERVKILKEEESLFGLYRAKALDTEGFGRHHKPLAERLTQIDDELPRLQAELDVLRISSQYREETLGEARDLAERWGSLPHDEKRQIIEAITDRIVVGEGEIEICLLQLSEPQLLAKGQREHTGSWRRSAERARGT